MLERTAKRIRQRFGSARLPRSWRTTQVEGHRVYHLAHETLVACRNGPYEERTVQRVRNWHGEGRVGFDIGANIGLFSIAVLGHSASGTIYAVEPNPATFARLRCTIEANNLCDHVTAFPVALSDRCGVANFAVHSPENSSGDGLLDTGRVGESRSNVVPTLTLDSIVEALGLKTVDWLKLDTEGAEFLVFKGGQRCLSRHRPRICFEAHPLNLKPYQVTPIDLYDFLTSLNYQIETAEGQRLEAGEFETAVNAVEDDNFFAIPTG